MSLICVGILLFSCDGGRPNGAMENEEWSLEVDSASLKEDEFPEDEVVISTSGNYVSKDSAGKLDDSQPGKNVK